MKDKITLEVKAGAGGNDAKDWAQMLLRMYRRYAENKGWQMQSLNDSTMEITGPQIYSILKKESGVHRLVRISPFDAKKLRHTSFALVEVLPEVQVHQIEIPDNDLKIDFYRSSGPGGQNVNKVETAVRIVHLPTGLVAASQADRSQMKNRERALRLLKAKLAKLMEEKKEKELSKLRTKVSPDWGHEIRSYVLHPYKMVKDHRSGLKISQVEKVLNGDLDLLFTKKVK